MVTLSRTNHLINLENPYQMGSSGKGSLNWHTVLCLSRTGHPEYNIGIFGDRFLSHKCGFYHALSVQLLKGLVCISIAQCTGLHQERAYTCLGINT